MRGNAGLVVGRERSAHALAILVAMSRPMVGDRGQRCSIGLAGRSLDPIMEFERPGFGSAIGRDLLPDVGRHRQRAAGRGSARYSGQ
jgi:hypothetical protein